jgi:transposase InsO family protein
MTAELVTVALTMAWCRGWPAPGALNHSERDSQYASHDFKRKLNSYGIQRLMSRKVICWDNAPT